MNPQDIDRVLGQTLSDRQLTGGEKRALAEVLDLAHLDDAKRAFIRHRAFALARAEMNSAESAAVLDWLEGVVKLLQPAPTPRLGESAAAHFSPGDDCVGQIAALIRQVKQRADVCVFTITDDRVTEPLLEAHRRGVELRVLTDDEKSHELGSDVYRLIEAGVPLRMDRSPHHMHHKFAIFDGLTLLTGSYNWTRGAALNNKENILVTGDARLVRAYARAFDRLWTEFA